MRNAEPPATLRARLHAVLAPVQSAARAGEISAAWLRAERSDFVRFNRGRVRQCGTVERFVLELRLIAQGRQARRSLVLGGDAAGDAAGVARGFEFLRAMLAQSPPDPFLSIDEAASGSVAVHAARLADVDDVTDTVCEAAAGADLVGFYAGGPVACAFVSSLGHLHWHESHDWTLDYAVYAQPGDGGGGESAVSRDKAVKATLGGNDWDGARVRASIAQAVDRASVLLRPSRRLQPGRYRAYLAPRAVADLLGMLGWGGFSARAHASGQSPLARLASGEAAFDPRVNLLEDLRGAGVPQFQTDGFLRPARLQLVREGAYAGTLVSPRSAREFGLPGNGACDAESPEALSLSAGDLDEQQALRRLGTGIAVSNLWYLNFSDRHACRITGLTRFATTWVQDGEIAGPVDVMRFDDSLYRVLGEELEALTNRAHRFPNTDTYDGRTFGAATAPGALLRGLSLTL